MSKNKLIFMISIFLTIATLVVFWQISNCDFINYDDPSYVTENNHIQYGISTDGIRWAFTTGYFSNWHPLTWISHMLDVQLFGLQPRWHHLTNLLFHIANTLLLFFVLHRMTKAHWESAFVAALFALHPLHVESVAWVAERKDVLSMFFWMLTMGAYCWYVEHPRFQRYLIVVVFFALGLMAKPMLVTLPFVLLLLDYWPLRRFQQTTSDQKIRTTVDERASGDNQKGNDSRYRWALIRSLLWEKIPLFALTVLSSIVTYFVQRHGGSVASFEKVPLSDRFSNTFISYITYIGKTIWPNDLAVLYPYPRLFPTLQVIGAALLLTAITLTVIGKAKRAPYLAMGWLWYAGTLVPVIGIVQVGLQARADRYTYIPLIGLFIMATWGISEFSKNWRYRKEALIASSTVVLLFLCIIAWTQVMYWKNSITLFEHALNVTDNNYIAYYNRGIAYSDLRSYQQAIADYDKVIEIKPKYAEAYSNRGNAYLHLGNDRQAIGDYDKAIEINPKHERAYNNRGTAYSNLGNNTQAIKDYDKAIEINPKYEKAYNNRGETYSSLGNYRQAIRDYNKAIEINPKYAKAYNNRGNACTNLGNYRQAIGDFDRAIEINPKYVEAYYNRGYAYSRIGNNKHASEDLKRAAKSGYKDGQDLFKKQIGG